MARTETPLCDFGAPAPDFTLRGVDGKTYRLADVRGAHGTVVMFICNHCPYVKVALDRMIRDAHELKGIGVGTVAIMPNDSTEYPEDSFENMKRLASEMKFPFPYLVDETQQVAKAYGAVCTPDFFGYDDRLGLQYRGRLDASRRELVPDARRDLFEAMKQVVETGKGPADQIASMGCSIKWRR